MLLNKKIPKDITYIISRPRGIFLALIEDMNMLEKNPVNKILDVTKIRIVGFIKIRLRSDTPREKGFNNASYIDDDAYKEYINKANKRNSNFGPILNSYRR
jgi:hypothetical protein